MFYSTNEWRRRLFGWIVFGMISWRMVASFRPASRMLRHFGASGTPRSVELFQKMKQQSSFSSAPDEAAKVLNLSTVTLAELEDLVLGLQFPKYRAQQIHQYIRNQGVLDCDKMLTLPKALREQLKQFCTTSALQLVKEQVSRVDGTIKRVYQLHDGALIESVLMGPYQDGRYTACISSQVGCAQQCVFCATGQMGFSRQLTVAEIFEQVARFHAELLSNEKKPPVSPAATTDVPPPQQQHGKTQRLSNVVFMGMGEPLANYKNVMSAVQRIISELGIGARRITISTVGIVPNIRKLAEHHTELPQFRLAVSLHSASDKERTALLPANGRNGGLNALMEALRDYSDRTGRRITVEWALIAGENDTVDTARQLGRLLTRHPQFPLRPDLVHVNVIPLNPTALYEGQPSRAPAVNAFCQTLLQEFGISCTPRVRRGIDIDAGCGQLTTKLRKEQEERATSVSEELYPTLNEEKQKTLQDFMPTQSVSIGVYNDDDDIDDLEEDLLEMDVQQEDEDEAQRLISLIQGTTIDLSALRDDGNY